LPTLPSIITFTMS